VSPLARSAEALAIVRAPWWCRLHTLLLALLLGGCPASTNPLLASYAVDNHAAQVLGTVADVWIAYDAARLDQCVAVNPTPELYKACADAWQAGPEQRIKAKLRAARDAMKTWDQTLDAVRAGEQHDLDAIEQHAWAAIRDLVAAINELGGGVPLSVVGELQQHGGSK